MQYNDGAYKHVTPLSCRVAESLKMLLPALESYLGDDKMHFMAMETVINKLVMELQKFTGRFINSGFNTLHGSILSLVYLTNK